MQLRFCLILSGTIALMAAQSISSFAEDQIRAIVGSNGRIVFTNIVVDNTPAPPAPILQETADILAGEMPPALRTLVDTIALHHGVDPGLVHAVMKTESNFNRWAVSNKGAL